MPWSASARSGALGEQLVALALAGGLVGQAVLAAGAGEPGAGRGGLAGWVTALTAVVVAGLLLARHRRARFAAYVWCSVLAARAAAGGDWAGFGLAVAAVLVLQTPPARRAWPRLRPGWRRDAHRHHSTAALE